MPLFRAPTNKYKPARPVQFNWDTFRGGLNSLLRENEIGKDELAQAENIVLKGKGIPTKRWGTKQYFQSGATGSVRGLQGYYTSLGTVELLALTDEGFLTKKNGNTYSTLQGASWASGYHAYMAQLDDKIYIVNGQRELVRYSLPTLVGFPTIAIPTGLGASNISNATGGSALSYRVSAVSSVGETLASTAISLTTQPAKPGGTAGGVVRLTWSGVSTASGVLAGYNVYGRSAGNERFLGSVGADTTVFYDNGDAIPREFTFPPTADTTGGPKAKYVIRFQDRLIFAGIDGEPSKVLISGRVPNQEKFDISYGGNYIDIEPDAGDNITQLVGFSDRIVVFKERSIWQITLGSEQVGNFFVTTPQLKMITASHGCISPRSVVPVENDVYFLSRNGVNALGYEPGFAFDVLRSNEISLKIRPFFKNLSITQKMNAVGVYHDFKYILAFPGLNKTMVFDRERLAWVGPWTVDANVFEVFYDSNNNEHLLYGSDTTPDVEEYSENFADDDGTAISTILRTRQEDFGDWSQFKTIKNIFTQFRSITGSVNVDIRLEGRSGSITSARNTNIVPNTGNSGWGADVWGTTVWGNSNTAGGGTDSQQVIRWFRLNKTARTMQMTIRTTGTSDSFELLGIRGDAKQIGSGVRPSSWRVT